MRPQQALSTRQIPGPVSAVIPVLNAEEYLPSLLASLFAQEPEPISEVILVDSMSTDRTREIASRFPQVRICPMPNFSHGRARNVGVAASSNPVVALLTQDALPLDECWLRNLVEPLADPGVAASFSRQVPRPHALAMERFFLEKRFPPGMPIRRAPNGKELGLDDVFFSNVAAAAWRHVLTAYPFDEGLIMSEDQQWARDVIKAGYATVYVPGSVVIHSHRYSLTGVFRRYFDSVYSITRVFPSHGVKTTIVKGARYMVEEAGFIARRSWPMLPYYCAYTAAKVSGGLLGHFAERLPRFLLRRLSLHSYHWK